MLPLLHAIIIYFLVRRSGWTEVRQPPQFVVLERIFDIASLSIIVTKHNQLKSKYIHRRKKIRLIHIDKYLATTTAHSYPERITHLHANPSIF